MIDQSTDERRNAQLYAAATLTAADAYVPTHNPTEADALGLAVARHFSWGCEAVAECAASMLEDANMHEEAEAVRLLSGRADPEPPTVRDTPGAGPANRTL